MCHRCREPVRMQPVHHRKRECKDPCPLHHLCRMSATYSNHICWDGLLYSSHSNFGQGNIHIVQNNASHRAQSLGSVTDIASAQNHGPSVLLSAGEATPVVQEQYSLPRGSPPLTIIQTHVRSHNIQWVRRVQ